MTASKISISKFENTITKKRKLLLFPIIRVITAQFLDFGTPFLLKQPRCFGGDTRMRRFADFRLVQRRFHQMSEAQHGIQTVLFLRSVAFRCDDQHAIYRHVISGVERQLLLDVRFQRGGIADVKAQLHCSRDLVDVLPTWSGRANIFELEFVFIDLYGGCDLNHALSIIVHAEIVAG